MASAIDNTLSLWLWPLSAAKLAGEWAETLSNANVVIDARTPVIEAAMASPATADHAELARMVSEKASAFGKSGRSVSAAQGKVRRAWEANVRVLGRMWAGEVLPLSAWIGVFERNLAIAATLAGIPAGALAPVRATAAGNARRLTRG